LVKMFALTMECIVLLPLMILPCMWLLALILTMQTLLGTSQKSWGTWEILHFSTLTPIDFVVSSQRAWWISHLCMSMISATIALLVPFLLRSSNGQTWSTWTSDSMTLKDPYPQSFLRRILMQSFWTTTVSHPSSQTLSENPTPRWSPWPTTISKAVFQTLSETWRTWTRLCS